MTRRRAVGLGLSTVVMAWTFAPLALPWVNNPFADLTAFLLLVIAGACIGRPWAPALSAVLAVGWLVSGYASYFAGADQGLLDPVIIAVIFATPASVALTIGAMLGRDRRGNTPDAAASG